MRSQWQAEMDQLADRMMFQTEPVKMECPVCGETFKPRWYEPKDGKMYGSWQVCCSKLCRKVYNEERREQR